MHCFPIIGRSDPGIHFFLEIGILTDSDGKMLSYRSLLLTYENQYFILSYNKNSLLNLILRACIHPLQYPVIHQAGNQNDKILSRNPG